MTEVLPIAPRRKVFAYELLGAFTAAERKLYFDGIREGNTELETVRELILLTKTRLDLSHPVVLGAMGILVNEGVVAQTRADAIIGGL